MGLLCGWMALARGEMALRAPILGRWRPWDGTWVPSDGTWVPSDGTSGPSDANALRAELDTLVPIEGLERACELLGVGAVAMVDGDAEGFA